MISFCRRDARSDDAPADSKKSSAGPAVLEAVVVTGEYFLSPTSWRRARRITKFSSWCVSREEACVACRIARDWASTR